MSGGGNDEEGPVWAVVLPRQGVLPEAALETLEEANQVADARRTTVLAVVVADGFPVEPVVRECRRYGATEIAIIGTGEAVPQSALAATVARRAEESTPLAVLFMGSARGVDLGARVGVLLRRRYADRCVRFEIGDGPVVHAVRSVHAGRQHSIERWSRGPFLGSMLPGVVGVSAGLLGVTDAGTPPIGTWPVGTESCEETVVSSSLGDPRDQDLRECDVIVAVGRGIGGAENLPAIRDLADALSAGIGGSRPVIEAGWLPLERQVGQTGRTVTPRLYIACGISGATQHLAGIAGAEVVVAINLDASAPILGRADLPIVGDLHEVVPALTRRVREAHGSVERTAG